jgi:hypothetical protein
MGSKNSYAARIKRQRQAEYLVLSQWISQAWADAFVIVTGQPDVMGRDTFGPDRTEKVLRAIEEMACYIHRGISKRDDAEAVMEQTDRALRQRLGDRMVPAEVRYEGWEWKEL